MSEPTASERAQTLRAVPLFHGLADEALEAIVSHATPFEAGAGHVLVEAGMEGAGLFVLEEGTVAVGAGPKKIELGPGECVGELALLADGIVRSARVAATTPVRGIAIARADFRKMLNSDNGLALSLLEVLARRLAGAAP